MQVRVRSAALRYVGLHRAVLTALLCAGLPAGAADKADLTGVWLLNAEASQELVKEPSGRGGMGGITPSVSVGGWGIPLPGGGSPEVSSSKLKDPDVLYAQELEIVVVDEVVILRYGGLSEEEMVPGNVQGRKVRWTGKKLTQSYSTSSRRVDKKFQLTGPDQMLVTVKLNPAHGSTRIYKKVFERRVPAA